MKRSPLLVLTTMATVALVSTPARAAFEGVYFGLETGYESNNSNAVNVLFQQPGPLGSLDQARSGGKGLAYGIFGGYAFELTDNWFASVEGSVSMSDAGFKFVDLDGSGAPIEGQGVHAVMKQSFALSAQLGYMLTDRLGVYGRLGLPGAKISYKSLAAGSSAITSQHSYFTSYQVGGGLQYAVGDHVFTRLEYTYSDLEIGPFGMLDGRQRLMFGIGLGY